MFSIIFPTIKTLDKNLLKTHFNYCGKLLEDFIVYYISQNNKEERLSILSKFYSEKNIPKQALKANTDLLTIVENNKLNYKNYDKLFKVNLDRFNILLNDFSYDTFKYAEKALHFLDKYYFLEKFNIRQELYTDTIMSNRTYEFKLLDEIKNEIDNDKSFHSKLLFEIYRISIELYERNVDKKSFFKFKKLIISNLDNFDFITKKSFLGDIGNYLSILYSKTADNSLLVEVFENYNRQIQHKTIITNKKIPDANFAQIVRIAMYLKEFEWANKFIKDYGIYLNNEDLILLSKAEISYSQLKFNETILLLNKVDLKTTKLNYELKSLYAKVLYDTNDIDLLNNHLKTFEIYLRRQKKLSKLIKESNLNFVLYLKRLVHNKLNKSYLIKLKKEIIENKTVFNRNRLLERLENINN